MYLLFDIGGTKTRIAVADQSDNDITKMEIVPTLANFDEAIEQIASIGTKLAGESKIESAAGGLGIPLDGEKKMAIFHSEKEIFHDWVGKPFKKTLQEKLKTSVFLENDAALGALGESVFGAGKDHQIVAYLTIGTGVGGARIVDGKIDESASGFEPGWQIIDPTGTLCPELDEKPLHLGIVSGASIKSRTGKSAKDIKDEVFWNRNARFLALGIHNTIVLWSPDVVVLGGSVSQHFSIEKISQELQKFPHPFEELPPIKRALLGEKCGLFGALQCLKDHV